MSLRNTLITKILLKELKCLEVIYLYDCFTIN